MRRYRLGDQGEPVRDIQDRLIALGYPPDPDPPATYGQGTHRAVCRFQDSRGLAADGAVGRETWRVLVEAGYHLGDRLLYHRLPMLRGDDVADLQRRLNALGFDTGKVDGIFGPETLAGLLDFQHNRHMAEDGISGPQVGSELLFMERATRKGGRADVREREWIRDLSRRMAGHRVVVDAFCRGDTEARGAWTAAVACAAELQALGAIPQLSRSADSRPPERVRAQRANRLAADIVVAFALPATDVPGVYYFAGHVSHSEAGAAMAGVVAQEIGEETHGRALPMLKETRAPAVVVSQRDLNAELGSKVAAALEAFFRSVQEPNNTP
ncbi:MAG: peptidoglycan-binding protein [Acidimicrobiia bacterium]